MYGLHDFVRVNKVYVPIFTIWGILGPKNTYFLVLPVNQYDVYAYR